MIRFLDLFRRRRRICQDPVFGRLEYDNRSCWIGEVLFAPTNGSVMLLLETGGPEPADDHRAAFSGLVERYASLRSSISVALFSLWEPHLQHRDTASTSALLTSPENMLRHTILESIHVWSSAQIKLGYGFDPDVGWDDAMLSVRIDGWYVTPESLDD